MRLAVQQPFVDAAQLFDIQIAVGNTTRDSADAHPRQVLNCLGERVIVEQGAGNARHRARSVLAVVPASDARRGRAREGSRKEQTC